MIPRGQNPFGLEDRILTFHVIENGTETESIQKTSRLYCWAEFPAEFIGRNFLQWSAQLATTQQEYETLPKYVTRNAANPNDPDQFMVLGDQDFYFQTWI